MTPSPVTPDFSPPIINGVPSHPLEAVHKSVDQQTGAEHLAAPAHVKSKRIKEVQETEEGTRVLLDFFFHDQQEFAAVVYLLLLSLQLL